MNANQFHHHAKSNQAYAYDANHLHLRVKTTPNLCQTIEVIHGDPFMWAQDEQTGQYHWMHETTDHSMMHREFQGTSFDHWFVSLNASLKRTKYAFLIDNRYLYGARDMYDLNEHPEQRYNLFNYFNFPYIHDVDRYQAPEWVKDTIWYSIFPDRFANLDNPASGLLPWGSVTTYRNDMFFGGNLNGIRHRLDYIAEMGFTGIYLTPIFVSPSAHKYDTVDYFQIDPIFGTEDDLRQLVQDAHARGIRVMLDAVYNHCSILHPFFQDVIANGPTSEYADCFYIHDYPVINFPTDERGLPVQTGKPTLNLNYETFGFAARMPKWNTEHPLVRDHLIKAGEYWIQSCGIDGWRLDVANEVSHDFWRVFQRRMRAVKSDVFLLGENWDDATPWLGGDQMDAVMNYEFLQPIWAYFGANDEIPHYSGARFQDAINNVMARYPKHVILNMFNMIDSHDTPRILHVCGNDPQLVRLAHIVQYSLPGAPSTFYGSEVGLGGQQDPDNRRCMIWDETEQDATMREFVRRLNRIYQQYDAFRTTDFTWIVATDDVLIYRKLDLTFAINRSNHAINIGAHLSGQWLDVFHEQPLSLSSETTIAPKTFWILQSS